MYRGGDFSAKEGFVWDGSETVLTGEVLMKYSPEALLSMSPEALSRLLLEIEITERRNHWFDKNLLLHLDVVVNEAINVRQDEQEPVKGLMAVIVAIACALPESVVVNGEIKQKRKEKKLIKGLEALAVTIARILPDLKYDPSKDVDNKDIENLWKPQAESRTVTLSIPIEELNEVNALKLTDDELRLAYSLVLKSGDKELAKFLNKTLLDRHMDEYRFARPNELDENGRLLVRRRDW